MYLRVVLLNVLINVWTRAVRSEVPDAKPAGYADDTGITTTQAPAVQSTLDLTGRFAVLTGQILNATKSHCWATDASTEMQLQGTKLLQEAVPISKGGRLLGAYVAYRKQGKNTVAPKRISRGVDVSERIRWAPLPMPARARLLSALVLPASLYGACISDVTTAQLHSLTSAIMRALWGTSRKLRCRDIVLTLFVPGHLTDPRQACIYQSLCMLRRFLQKDPQLFELCRKVWQGYLDGRQAPGPVGIVHAHVRRLGWSWKEFEHFERPGRFPLPVLGGPDSWRKHELRDGIRIALWAQAGARRNDMRGLEATTGVDRGATLALLGSRLPPDEIGLLRSIVAGSVRLQKRLHDAQLVDTSTCTFCGMHEETLRHCFWECPRWAPVRACFDLPSSAARESWPACTFDCGIFMESQQVIDMMQMFQQRALSLHEPPCWAESKQCREHLLMSCDLHEEQTLWTDGACCNNQDIRFRRAGSGIFYGDGHAMSFSIAVPGLIQTNQRAELLAVVLACLRDPRPLDIRSDSDYVCSGCASWQQWHDKGWKGEHSDLWNMLAKELGDRATNVRVSWVKGHAKKIDIARGRSTELDKWGNDGADALAVRGAETHRVSDSIVQSAKLQKTATKANDSQCPHHLLKCVGPMEERQT